MSHPRNFKYTGYRRSDEIDVYKMSSAYRRTLSDKKYPFSSLRQDARTDRSQIMVVNGNGKEIMNAIRRYCQVDQATAERLLAHNRLKAANG